MAFEGASQNSGMTQYLSLPFDSQCLIEHQHLEGWSLEKVGILEAGGLMKDAVELNSNPAFLNFEPRISATAGF